jgi:hypothetical protein
LADFVAKVGGPLQVRNFRIQWARRLNQSCPAGLFFESMLRVGMRKIFLQQYRHKADIRGTATICPLLVLTAAVKLSTPTLSLRVAASA